MTRISWLYLVALFLPVTFLGVEATLLTYQQATAKTYTVVVEGYDPRDLVYGEYLQFRPMWDDPASEKTGRDTKDLPDIARMYLPEGNAWDLQTMLQERGHVFTATLALSGTRARIHALYIDSAPWEEGLETWRDRKDKEQRIEREQIRRSLEADQ